MIEKHRDEKGDVLRRSLTPIFYLRNANNATMVLLAGPIAGKETKLQVQVFSHYLSPEQGKSRSAVVDQPAWKSATSLPSKDSGLKS